MVLAKNKREEHPPASIVPSLSQHTWFKKPHKYNIMIRVFNAFDKSFFNCNSDFTRFSAINNNLNIHLLICPHCRAKFDCSYFSSYSRNMITFENGLNTCHTVSITRVICNSCNHTHAILPDHLIPFGSYTLSFILKVLRAYFLGSKTITCLCDFFQISISTLYGWIRLFKEQKHIWLGILNDAVISEVKFIDDLLSCIKSVSSFYQITKTSFLQNFKTTHSNSS